MHQQQHRVKCMFLSSERFIFGVVNDTIPQVYMVETFKKEMLVVPTHTAFD